MVGAESTAGGACRTVLVEQRAVELEEHTARHRRAAVVSERNKAQVGAQQLGKAHDEAPRLRRQPQPTPGRKMKFEEGRKILRTPAEADAHAFAAGATDRCPSAFCEPAPELRLRGRKREAMTDKLLANRSAGHAVAHLDAQALTRGKLPQRSLQHFMLGAELLPRAHADRPTAIAEGQADVAPPGQQAADACERDAGSQAPARPEHAERNDLVAILLVQQAQPSSMMEDVRLRACKSQLLPARVVKRV